MPDPDPGTHRTSWDFDAWTKEQPVVLSLVGDLFLTLELELVDYRSSGSSSRHVVTVTTRSPVRKVGARELKTRLGTWLRRVEAGLVVIVTERGRPVAELRPLTASADVADLLARLQETGVLGGGVGRLPAFEPVPGRARPSLSDAIVEDRQDRI